MVRFLVSDDRYRLEYNGPQAHRAAFAGSLNDPRFGRICDEAAIGRLHRIRRTLKRMVEAAVDSKMQRVERELELLGIQTRDNR